MSKTTVPFVPLRTSVGGVDKTDTYMATVIKLDTRPIALSGSCLEKSILYLTQEVGKAPREIYGEIP